MKDFAKSIRVANSKDKNGKDVNVGDLVKVKTDDPSLTLGKVKSVSGETIKVDMTGDDDIWTTPARLVEKVGNSKVGNEAVVLKDGDVWVVLYANETKSKEFDTEAEARAFAKQVGNSKVGNAYKPDVSKTPADYERMIKQAKTADELGEMNDDIEYDIKEYEIAIDDCNMRIKDYQRMISSLRMVQRNAKDAQNKM